MAWDDRAPADDTWDSGPAAGNDQFSDKQFGEGDNGLGDDAGFGNDHGGGADQGVGGGPGDGGACRNCGQEGHFARQCPEPKKMGECFRCGEVGHNKTDCTNEAVERAFTGECRTCGEQGHRAADCPYKAPEMCRACGVEGHKAQDCDKNRTMDRSHVAEMDAEAAWEIVKKAAIEESKKDSDKDTTDIVNALDSYVKAKEDVTYPDIEKRLRAENVPIFCIAQEKEVPMTTTLVNLQGKSGCTYVVSYSFRDKPRRKIHAEGWPASKEDNMDRLADAGVMMEKYVPQCRNCKEMGHMSKACTQEKVDDPAAISITCSNCGETGHRLRDCPAERQQRGGAGKDCRKCGEIGHMAKDCPNAEASGGGGRACHNCGSEDHMARDCTEPRTQTCRNCREEGHMSKECDKPRDPSTVTCRNCDAVGHFSKECPEPKDWMRVKCSNCNEMGHTFRRCKEPSADEVDANSDGDVGAADNFDSAPVTSGDDW